MSRQFWYSTVIACALLSVLMTVISIFISVQAEKERTLISELQQLRAAVKIYQETKGVKPATLSEALSNKLPFSVTQYSVATDPSNRPLDPFSKPYLYDPISGWVKSQSPKYESW